MNQRTMTAVMTPIWIETERKMEMRMVKEMMMERMMTGVSQSHYFQTERTSLPPAPGLHQRMMRLRVEKTTPAMEVGKTLRRRKMSEEVMLPARHFKTNMKLHKKMSFQSKFPAKEAADLYIQCELC